MGLVRWSVLLLTLELFPIRSTRPHNSLGRSPYGLPLFDVLVPLTALLFPVLVFLVFVSLIRLVISLADPIESLLWSSWVRIPGHLAAHMRSCSPDGRTQDRQRYIYNHIYISDKLNPYNILLFCSL